MEGHLQDIIELIKKLETSRLDTLAIFNTALQTVRVTLPVVIIITEILILFCARYTELLLKNQSFFLNESQGLFQ